MTALTFFAILAALATLGALLTGVGSMASGGSFDRRHSDQFMFARVGLQAIAVLLVLLALFVMS